MPTSPLTLRPVPRAERRAGRMRLLASATVAVLIGGLGAALPANADPAPLPRVLLTGGAAVVEYTYTATSTDGSWPEGSTLQYQWFRGNHEADAESFVPIEGATDQQYTLTDEDHWNRVQVRVQAWRDGAVVAEKFSSHSNYILWRGSPPVLSGVPHVGQTITASLGPWATEWDMTLAWRNTGVEIPGENGVTYRTRPADAGKEISLLALGEYTYPNGVHPIDRYASRMRIRWGTRAILKGRSPGPRRLRLSTIAYAAGANQSTVRGHVRLYDGKRRVKEFWIPHGRKVVELRGLRRGRHNILMVFDQNPWFDTSRTRRTFLVR